ncbi:MAG: hypothetical protein IJ777_03810 [Clostridia bacterium]|nr:hypothetical protein [Clostridia bacterium]
MEKGQTKTPMKQQNRKKKKIKLNSNPKIILVSVAILCIAIYALSSVIKLIKNPTDTFTVEQGKIYQEEQATGYIIRDETVVKGSNYKNGMEQIKTEGERVAKDEAIFRYYTNGEEGLVKKIADLDAKIDEVMAKEKGILTGDMRALDKQIDDKIDSLYTLNNLQNINEAKKTILTSITKKAKIAGEYSPAGSYLKKLIDERSKYENQLNEGAEYVTAPVSGVVSYKVDGYEDILTTKDFSTMTQEFLENLNLKTGQVVVDSKESGKIIDNFKCYIVCDSKSSQAKQAKVGDTVTLRMTNGNEIASSIEYISIENNTVILIFKIEKSVQELMSYRKISFDIVWWSDHGKKIPNEAIGYEQKGENQLAYVVRMRLGYEDKIWIKILRQNEKYAIVDNYSNTELRELGCSEEEIKQSKSLTLYDEILEKPTH